MGFCLFVCECVGEDDTVTYFCNHWYQVEVSSLCVLVCVFALFVFPPLGTVQTAGFLKP